MHRVSAIGVVAQDRLMVVLRGPRSVHWWPSVVVLLLRFVRLTEGSAGISLDVELLLVGVLLLNRESLLLKLVALDLAVSAVHSLLVHDHWLLRRLSSVSGQVGAQ